MCSFREWDWFVWFIIWCIKKIQFKICQLAFTIYWLHWYFACFLNTESVMFVSELIWSKSDTVENIWKWVKFRWNLCIVWINTIPRFHLNFTHFPLFFTVLNFTQISPIIQTILAVPAVINSIKIRQKRYIFGSKKEANHYINVTYNYVLIVVFIQNFMKMEETNYDHVGQVALTELQGVNVLPQCSAANSHEVIR